MNIFPIRKTTTNIVKIVVFTKNIITASATVSFFTKSHENESRYFKYFFSEITISFANLSN